MNTFLGFVIIALFVWWMLAVVEYLSRIANRTAVIIDEIRDNARWPSTPDYSEVLAEIKETLDMIAMDCSNLEKALTPQPTPEQRAEAEKKFAEFEERARREFERQEAERQSRLEQLERDDEMSVIEDVIELEPPEEP